MHQQTLAFDGLNWNLKSKLIEGSFLEDRVAQFRYLPKSQKYLLATEKSEV
jgi:hypothetical protein